MDYAFTKSTRERIITSTLDLIKSEGFQNVTVRKIARKANVNIASINYHFGSKDAVINESLNHVTYELLDCFKILEAYDLSAEIRLRKFLQDYTDILQKYPYLIKNFISLIMNNCDIKIHYSDFLKKTGFNLIKASIGEIKPQDDEASIEMRAIQLMSCTAYPILIGTHLNEISSFDFDSQEQRYKYLEVLLNGVLS